MRSCHCVLLLFFLLQAITYFPHQQDRALLDLVCRWVPAFSRCLMCQLIEDCSIGGWAGLDVCQGHVAWRLPAVWPRQGQGAARLLLMTLPTPTTTMPAAEKELAKVLRPHEVEAVLASKHRPNYCLQILSAS